MQQHETFENTAFRSQLTQVEARGLGSFLGAFCCSSFRFVFKSFLDDKKGAKREVFGGQNEVKIHFKK